MTNDERVQLRSFSLECVGAANGSPLSDVVLRTSIRQGLPHLHLTETDIGAEIRKLETDEYLQGTVNSFTKKAVWVLTDAGQLAIR
jgi:hypothetical protein